MKRTKSKKMFNECYNHYPQETLYFKQLKNLIPRGINQNGRAPRAPFCVRPEAQICLGTAPPFIIHMVHNLTAKIMKFYEIKPVATFKLPLAPCAWRMATIGHRCFKLFEKNNVLHYFQASPLSPRLR